jgi:hypothetical protein
MVWLFFIKTEKKSWVSLAFVNFEWGWISEAYKIAGKRKTGISQTTYPRLN